MARYLGGKDDNAADVARRVTRSYQEHIRFYARMGYLDMWNATIDENDVLVAVSEEAHRRKAKLMA